MDEAWNFGPTTQRRVRVGDVVSLLQKRLSTLVVEEVPERSGRAESGLLELDSSKAMSRLAWRPVWEDQMIERTLDWYRAYYEKGQLISDDQLNAYCDQLDRAR